MAMASFTLPTSFPIAAALRPRCPDGRLAVRTMTLDFSGSFFEAGGDDDRDPPSASPIALEDKEEPQCPPGLMQYETMSVLWPECRRTNGSLLPREMKVARCRGRDVCGVFNRGVIPLAYSLKTKNKAPPVYLFYQTRIHRYFGD